MLRYDIYMWGVLLHSLDIHVHVQEPRIRNVFWDGVDNTLCQEPVPNNPWNPWVAGNGKHIIPLSTSLPAYLPAYMGKGAYGKNRFAS